MAADRAELGNRLAHLLRAHGIEQTALGQDFAALHRMHATDLRALVLVMESGRSGAAMTPSRLGEELELSSASVTALVDRLERTGQVRRVRDTADRRRVDVHITEQAMALGAAFFGPQQQRLVEAMADFTVEELAVVARFLTAMTEVVGAVRTEQRAARSAQSAALR